VLNDSIDENVELSEPSYLLHFFESSHGDIL